MGKDCPMHNPLEKEKLTVQEAATVLNVRRERIWKLISEGILIAEPSRVDGRRKVIPREQVEALLLEEGYRPRRTVQRRTPDAARQDPVEAVHTIARPWPQSIGMVSDGTLSSSESEKYLRKHAISD
jgi:excisionase family DNA binding protein